MDESKCVSCSLKLTTEGIWTRVSVCIGNWLHYGIVYGKNKCLYVSLEVCICLYVSRTISIVLMDSDVWGSQIEHEYSNFGLTSTWYAWVFICWFDVFRFRFKKPSALLPFDVMSLMCLSHLRLDCTAIPIYLAEPTDSSIWLWRM